MTAWVESAGVWQHDLDPSPCIECRTSGAHAGYATTLDDKIDGPFCNLTCWARHADRTVDLTGSAHRVEHPRRVPHWDDFSAWVPPTGPQGISAAGYGPLTALVYRDEHGVVAGILMRTEINQWTVVVDPGRRQQGIGKRLVRAAARRWGINLDHQRLTPEGLTLARAAVPSSTPI